MYKVCCGVAKIYEGLCTLFSSSIICVVFPSLKTKVIMVKDHEDYWNTTLQHNIFIIINEGDIGGYPKLTTILGEKLANIEIPPRKSMKYRYRIYDESRLINFKVVIISRDCLSQAQQPTSAIARKHDKTSI